MKYTIVHELPGRIRFRAEEKPPFSAAEGTVIEALLKTQPGITSARSSWRTQSILVTFDAGKRETILLTMKALTRDLYADIVASMPEAPEPNSGLADILLSTTRKIVVRALLPLPLRHAVTLLRALPFFAKGARSLLFEGRLNVSVLDGAAIATSILQNDFKTASTVMYLLSLGDELEEWTHRRSRENLSESLQLHIDSVWVCDENGVEREIPARLLKKGDCIVVRQGTMIPADGVVESGEATVNQATMTGESEPVHRTPGQGVFAGTIVEEGELHIRVTALSGNTRVDEVARLIDESESRKAIVQAKAEHMADGLVPYNFLLAGLVYLFTRNLQRASAALMADYSCAIKLATPLTILTAMSTGVREGVLIKGGKYLEALSSVDTVVFDKTGTLTVSHPSVCDVMPMPGYSRDGILRIAACLEEHFPHSLARAVVKEAEVEGLKHREEHDKLQYVVAHGIRSSLYGKQALIGSAHFIFEDEHIPCNPETLKAIQERAAGATTLFLALGEHLAGAIFIEDPLRPEAKSVVSELRREGVKNVVMLTGDNVHTAKHVASRLGVDDFRAGLLPAGKIDCIKEFMADGARTAMVGDGINDSPSLAAADVGISMSSATDIAQEVADVVLYQGIQKLPYARRLSTLAMQKIERNYRAIVGVNSVIITAGVLGVLTPGISALLHNLFTLGVALYSMTPIDAKTDTDGD